MNILLTKTNALGDQLLGFGFVRHLIRTTGCNHFFWLVRPGMESVADLWEGSTVVVPDQTLAPGDAAAMLLRQLAGQRPAVAPVFIVVPMNAYQSWPPDQDLASTVTWWGDFVRALRPELAITGSCTMNWVDWFLTLASQAGRRAGMAPGIPDQELDPAVAQYFATHGCVGQLTHRVPTAPQVHELDHYRALVTSLGFPDDDLRIQLELSATKPPAVWSVPNALVVFPGTGDTERCWPIEHFAWVIRELIANGCYTPERVVILEGPADAVVAGQLHAALAPHGIRPRQLRAGPADLRNVAGLLQQTTLLLTNETAIAHLAAAIDTPTVAIWGGGHWGRFVPRQGRLSVVHQPLACFHCDWHCLFEHYRCIRDIAPAAVLKAAIERLTSSRSQLLWRPVPAMTSAEVIRERFHGLHRELTKARQDQATQRHWLDQEILRRELAEQQAQVEQAAGRTADQQRAQAEEQAQLERAARAAAEQQADADRSARRLAEKMASVADQLRVRAEQHSQTEQAARQAAEEATRHAEQLRRQADERAAAESAARLVAEQRTTEWQAESSRQSAALAALGRETDVLCAHRQTLLSTTGALRTVVRNCFQWLTEPLRRGQRDRAWADRLTRFRQSSPNIPRSLAVTFVNTHDIVGGAERASYDLLNGFRGLGARAKLMVGGKHGHDVDVVPLKFSWLDWRLGRFGRDRLGLTEVVYWSPLRTVVQSDLFRNCDVVNLHNLHGRYWNLLTIPLLRRRCPVVVTLHDEFLLTGDCAYSYDCGKWQKTCGACPQADWEKSARYPAVGPDRTRLNLWIKRAIFRHGGRHPMHVVAPTQWLADKARAAPTLRHLPVTVIPYGIPLDLWRPLPQTETRRQLGLPADKIIGVFSATNLAERRKGTDVISEVIAQLPAGTAFYFVGLGRVSAEWREALAGYPVRFVGHLRERNEVVRHLSAADFSLVLSRADNLPYAALESLACGRPVIGTRVGGIPEIIESPELGWLVPNPPTVAAVLPVLTAMAALSASDWQARFQACRQSAERRYDAQRMVREYQQLFTTLVRAS